MARTPRLTVVPSGPAWQQLLRRRGPNIIADLRNALIVLRHEPAFAACFAFDEMQQAAMILDKPPICQDAIEGAVLPRMVDPEDVSRLQEWMQQNFMPKLGRETVEYALETFARERLINPLKSELELLEWDGEQRIGVFLNKSLGCPDDEYHRQIGAMFLIQMVARVFKPGCQADYMLVLEGPQGEEKSRFCRALAGDEYFSDALPHLNTDRVRVSMHLRGKWLLEIPELSSFNKAEAGALKAFITQRVEIYTPKYGRKERREPRQCVFIGTTNDDEYINDETGGRRYWPVKVEKVDLDWLAQNRQQLMAEAVQAYHEGKPHWPDRAFERDIIQPKQEEKQVHDYWQERVLDAIDLNPNVVSVPGIWSTISGDLNVKQMDARAQRRIANVLKKQGYRRSKDVRGRAVWLKPEF